MQAAIDEEAGKADTPMMAGKTVLVTGGTGGIGDATAVGLARLGARVGITGRDIARTEAAATSIRAAWNNAAVDAFAADLSSQTEVRRLAHDVLDRYPRLNVLVNNVGGFWSHRHLTADGPGRHVDLSRLVTRHGRRHWPELCEADHPSRSKCVRRSGPTQTSRRAIGSVCGPPANDVLSHPEIDHPSRRHEHRAGQLVGRADRAKDENPRQHSKHLGPGAERDRVAAGHPRAVAAEVPSPYRNDSQHDAR
jgi:short chain dehydrogenase